MESENMLLDDDFTAHSPWRKMLGTKCCLDFLLLSVNGASFKEMSCHFIRTIKILESFLESMVIFLQA